MPIFGNPESSLIGPAGAAGLSPNLGMWIIGTNYVEDDWVYHAKAGYGLCMFRCILDHLADAGNEPVTGGTYLLYWEAGPGGGQDGTGNVSTLVSVTTPGKIPAWDGSIVDVSPFIELVLNPGFETAGAGSPDVVSNWFEIPADGAISRTIVAAEIHSGIAALKLVSGATIDGCYVYQVFNVTPGVPHMLSFWTIGDGVNAGKYRIDDNTHPGVPIIPITTTGVVGTTYTQVITSFFIPAGCVSISIVLFAPPVLGGISCFDDVSMRVGAIINRYLTDGYAVSTIISSSSLDTELPTAKAVNSLVSNLGFFLTMTEDRVISDGKVHAFVIPGDLHFILDDGTYDTTVTSGYLVIKW